MSIFEQISEQKTERYCVKPSIVIGLGGTGTEICLKLKTLVNQKVGSDFPLVKFLLFDTDVADIMNVKSTTQSEVVAHNQVKSLFTPNEFYHLTVKDVAGIIKNADKHPHIFSWFPKNLEISDISSGANQIRSIGRLALYWNIAQVVDAINRVKKEVSSIKNKALASEKGFEVQDGFAVYILTSLCGGSGSGMFMDMGYLIRDLVENAEVNACCVMPSVFQIEQQDSIEANAYAALKELDHLMTKQEFTLNIGPQSEPKIFKTKPFDRCYLLDSWTESGLHIENLQSVSEIASNVIFYDLMTVSGKRHRSVIDNVKYKLNAKICDRVSAYSSFGLSSIFFDAARVKRSCAASLAEEFAIKFIKPCDKKDVKTRVMEFVRVNHLNEEITDDVITFIRTDGRSPVKAYKSPSDFDAFSMDKMLPEIQKWYSELKNMYMTEKYKVMDQNLEILATRVISLIEKESETLLSDRRLGINYAEAYLSSLDIIFKSYSDMLAQEANKLREQKKQLLIPLKMNKVTELMSSFWSYLIYKSKILEARDDLVFEMVKDVNIDIDIYIREHACIFYRRACDKISEILMKRVAELKNFISYSEKSFEKIAFEMINPRTAVDILTEKRIKCSAQDVEQVYKKYYPADMEDVIEKFLSSVAGPVNMWDLSKKDEILDKILKYCSSFFDALDATTIFSLIKDDGSAADVTDDLMRSAASLWSYSTVEMPSGTQIDEIEIISMVEKDRQEFFKYLRDQSKAVNNPSIDNHRITVMRFRHGLPLFALTALKRDLKPAYEMFKTGASVNTPKKPLHLSAEFETLPDVLIS
ncbi:MAG TPA: tubulin-like doman-containing protein [Candidatus Wallbacteria bacterium]|nr:tubulin-like doman-containing protein [Candidatus Wallbacteria bacterium]